MHDRPYTYFAVYKPKFWLACSHGGGITAVAVAAATENSAAIAAPLASPRPASLPADRRVRSDPSPALRCAAKEAAGRRRRRAGASL